LDENEDVQGEEIVILEVVSISIWNKQKKSISRREREKLSETHSGMDF
jgi:hypothetical protein